jgi:hypothetical protein
VSFQIPADAPESDESDPHRRIVWVLSATSSVRGLNFGASFEVPVFNTGAAPFTNEELEAAQQRRRSLMPQFSPDESNVVVRAKPDGATEFVFPPRRRIGTTVGTLIVVALLSASAAGMVKAEAPMFIPAIVGALALLFLVALVGSFFYTLRIIVRRPTVTIRHTVLGVGPSPLVLEISDIENVTPALGNEGESSHFWLKFKMKRGKSHTAAAMIPERREAEWIAGRIRQATRF